MLHAKSLTKRPLLKKRNVVVETGALYAVSQSVVKSPLEARSVKSMASKEDVSETFWPHVVAVSVLSPNKPDNWT